MTVDPYLPCPLPIPDYLAAFRARAERLTEIAAMEDLATPVTTCGEWTLRELLRHVGFVHRWATLAIATATAPDRAAVAMPDGEDADVVASWFNDGATALFLALDGLDPEAATWHPFPAPRTGALWIRRMTHETTIHTIDAELALGGAPVVDSRLASDGIDEYLSLILPHLVASGKVELPPGSLHLHCIDVDGEWVVNAANGLELRREHAKGDAAIRGPAAALLADLWGRRGRLGDSDIIGNAGVAEAWLAIGGN